MTHCTKLLDTSQRRQLIRSTQLPSLAPMRKILLCSTGKPKLRQASSQALAACVRYLLRFAASAPGNSRHLPALPTATLDV
jgi:hypothetical protein